VERSRDKGGELTVGDLLNKALGALERENVALQDVVQHIDLTRKVGQTSVEAHRPLQQAPAAERGLRVPRPARRRLRVPDRRVRRLRRQEGHEDDEDDVSAETPPSPAELTKLKSDLADARRDVKRLEADFLDQLKDKVGQLNGLAEEAPVAPGPTSTRSLS